jgi:hypothetical protein
LPDDLLARCSLSSELIVATLHETLHRKGWHEAAAKSDPSTSDGRPLSFAMRDGGDGGVGKVRTVGWSCATLCCPTYLTPMQLTLLPILTCALQLLEPSALRRESNVRMAPSRAAAASKAHSFFNPKAGVSGLQADGMFDFHPTAPLQPKRAVSVAPLEAKHITPLSAAELHSRLVLVVKQIAQG